MNFVMMRKVFRLFVIVFVLLTPLLQGCTPSRYSIAQDAAPVGGFDGASVPDAVPRPVKRTLAGNKSPYTVRGKTYHVIESAEGFRQNGIASWYGKKFHGHKTSNGEIYSMYGMTAAHKTLPIPSYVKVTNVDNGKTTVVRVNDRGPFHEGRIIDLSYAAAQKLGYAGLGTANVIVEVVVATTDATKANVTKTNVTPVSYEMLADGEGYFIQVGAYSNASSALKMKNNLASLVTERVFISESRKSSKKVYRVRIGPFSKRAAVETVQGELQKRNFHQAMVIVRPLESS